MSAPAVRTFLLSRDDPDDAWAGTVRLAEVLVRRHVTDRYDVSRHVIKGPRDVWGVYLTDRTPVPGPPPLLVIRAFRDFGLAA